MRNQIKGCTFVLIGKLSVIQKQEKMYKEITIEEYTKHFNDNHPNLRPFSSFTDPDGMHPLGNGSPQYVTEYALRDSESPIVKAETKVFDGKSETKYFHQEVQ